MTTNDLNQNTEAQQKNKKPPIARWIFCGLFATCSLVYAFHYSSFLLAISAFLMCPLPFVESFLRKIKINKVIAIILSSVLFFAGIIVSPLSESEETNMDSPNQEITESIENKNDDPSNDSTDKTNDVISNTTDNTENANNTTENTSNSSSGSSTNNSSSGSSTNNSSSGSSTNNNNSSSNDEKSTMVWIPSSGTKYHSNSSCSKMKSPRQVSLEEAVKQGYEPCKKCY